LVRARHTVNHLARFGAGEHDGQAGGLFGADRIQRRVEFDLEHFMIKKEQRTPFLDRQGIQVYIMGILALRRVCMMYSV
jgi:hypothetical protein